MGLLSLGLAVAAILKNHYKDPLPIIAGAIYLFFALILFLISFSKIANKSSIGRNPFVTSILCVVLVLIGIWTLLGLRNVLAAFF